MEMEFTDPARRRRVVLIVLGAALALAAGYGAFLLSSRGGAQAAVPTKPVLVAARDISARAQVTSDDVVVRQIREDEALAQAYALPTDVVGRVTSVPIYTDQQITPNLFATAAADDEFSILGPDEQVTLDSPYWRAVAVRIPAERAVGGAIEAGQRVDLFVSVDIEVLVQDESGNWVETSTASEDGFQAGKSTKIVYDDLEVLKALPDDELYVLKVDLKQAEEIAHVQQVGPDSFAIALRPDADTRAPDPSQYGVTTDSLVMTYLFRAPQLIDLSQLLGGTPGASPVPGGTGGETPDPDASPDPNASPDPDASPAPSPSSTPES